METLKYFISRGKEPSTYATLAATLGAIGISLSPGLLQSLILVGTAISILLGIILPERTK